MSVLGCRVRDMCHMCSDLLGDALFRRVKESCECLACLISKLLSLSLRYAGKILLFMWYVLFIYMENVKKKSLSIVNMFLPHIHNSWWISPVPQFNVWFITVRRMKIHVYPLVRVPVWISSCLPGLCRQRGGPDSVPFMSMLWLTPVLGAWGRGRPCDMCWHALSWSQQCYHGDWETVAWQGGGGGGLCKWAWRPLDSATCPRPHPLLEGPLPAAFVIKYIVHVYDWWALGDLSITLQPQGKKWKYMPGM